MPKINKIYLIIGVIILIGAALWYNNSKKPIATTNETITAEIKTIIQEVSVTGKIKPADSIDLSFEKSGKINNVMAEIGDKIKAEQLLVSINSEEISASLAGAKAALDSANARLNELIRGTRPEELKITETAVNNAQKDLVDAKSSLADIKEKTKTDLSQTYDSALTAAAKSVSMAANSLIVLTDIQFFLLNISNPTSQDYTNSANLADAKAIAILALLGGQNAGNIDNNTINQLSGGAKAAVEKARANLTGENTASALAQTKNSLEKVKAALQTIPLTSSLTSAQTISLNAEKTSINNEIIIIASKEQSIEVQKVNNNSAVNAAESKINSVNNILLSAEDTLALKKAGSAPEQISAQKAAVKQVEAQIKNYEIQISQSIIKSPISGIVTKQEAKIGKNISANQIIVSIISEAKFQIETNIPEADITKIKINDPAKVTLDAYGNDILFEAKVISIDPAETTIEGVSTYKTTLEFTKEDDQIKSGMTANIDILTAKKENAIAIPQRTIITENGQKFVLIDLGNGAREKRKVETGLRGSDGNIEIISGLSAGEKVIISVTQ